MIPENFILFELSFFLCILSPSSLSLNHYLIIIEFILCTLNGQKYQPETQFRGICKNLVRPEVDALRANVGMRTRAVVVGIQNPLVSATGG